LLELISIYQERPRTISQIAVQFIGRARWADLVMAWSVDRLGRSLQKLVAFLEDMHAKKIDLYLHKQGIDTTTPSGKAMFQLCSVFAEFEQAMIRDRVLAGLARAKEKGKTLGRPKISSSVERSILLLRQQGNGIKKIAKQLKVGVSVVQRVISNS
jgi:DNA invertase Pin-like site-specific DNA recombinase